MAFSLRGPDCPRASMAQRRRRRLQHGAGAPCGLLLGSRLPALNGSAALRGCCTVHNCGPGAREACASLLPNLLGLTYWTQPVGPKLLGLTSFRPAPWPPPWLGPQLVHPMGLNSL